MNRSAVQDKRYVRTTGGSTLRVLPLVGLLGQIIDYSDHAALRELHDHRRIFWYADKGPLLLAEFLDRLRYSPLARHYTGNQTPLQDTAYDLTLDKFSHLPPSPAASRNGNGEGDEGATDCRCYFRVVLNLAGKWHQRHPGADALALEGRSANLLQRAVVWNHYRSCREVRRQDSRGRSRYDYARDGVVLHLFMPTRLAGSDRRHSLESLVPDLDPRRPGEQQRVQAIIDQRFGPCRHMPLSAALEAPTPSAATDVAAGCVEEAVDALGLAEAVAREKVHRLGDQRSSIRRLGPARVHRLILARFASIIQGDSSDAGQDGQQDGKLAREFGMTLSSFSRFCGSRRLRTKGPHAAAQIGDLWANTAEVVASHGRFLRAAQEAGVWQRIVELRQALKPEAKHES